MTNAKYRAHHRATGYDVGLTYEVTKQNAEQLSQKSFNVNAIKNKVVQKKRENGTLQMQAQRKQAGKF